MEKAQKDANKGSQLKANQAALTLKCHVCLQLFICTVSARGGGLGSGAGQERCLRLRLCNAAALCSHSDQRACNNRRPRPRCASTPRTSTPSTTST